MGELMDEARAKLESAYKQALRDNERLRSENSRLTIELGQCQDDISRSIKQIDVLSEVIAPKLKENTDETDKKTVVANNVATIINELSEKYRQLKIKSTASKNYSASFDKYNTLYKLYRELREVSLGYIVGLDANLWTSDAPREKVEKMYLANTDYWLAYAAMAVMLWASHEEEACQRAVSKGMQMNERKVSLFFVLASLRFNRIEAAKEWYKVYFKIVDENGIGNEIIYILQALLSGALGSDKYFNNEVCEKMRELIDEARNNPDNKRLVSESVDNHISKIISVSSKEFLNLKYICTEYEEMMDLVSCAEKNEKLRKFFLSIIQSDFSLKYKLADRIEDALYSLISALDEPEQALMDKITYQRAVLDAEGKVDIAKEAYAKMITERDNKNNMSLVMTDAALDSSIQTDSRVRKFCLNSIQDDCIEGVERFASQYRKKEKKKYKLNVDGCELDGNEDTFEENKSELLCYYDTLIKRRIKSDKTYNMSKYVMFGAAAVFALFFILSVVGFASSWYVGACVAMLLIAVIAVAVGVLMGFMNTDQKKKIKKAFEYRIQNGVQMLKLGLEDMAQWRKYYKEQDAIYVELMRVLREEI